MALKRRTKPSPAGCKYFLTLQEHLGQRRSVKGARKQGYSSLKDVRKALHRLAFQKRYNERLRGGDEFIITKQCGGSDFRRGTVEITSTACRPTVTGTIRCRAYTGYTSTRPYRSPGATLRGVKRKKKKKKRSRRK